MANTPRGPSACFFVLYGEEDFFLDRGVEAARRWPNRSITVLDASEGLNDIDLVQELETRSIEDTSRTIIVEEAHKLKESKKKALRAYVDEWSTTDISVVLVAVVRSDKLSDLWAHVGAKGKLTEHKKFKPWPDKSGKTEAQKWIESEAKRVGLLLEDGVPELIIQMTGSDLYRMLNELRKLHLLVGGGGNKVTKQHVASVIAVTPVAEPRDVIEAAFAKNSKLAMNSLSVLYKTMGDEASIPVTYGMMREVQKIITARHMLDKRLSEDDIAIALGMNPWRCKSFFLPIVRKHDRKSLVQYMHELCKLDRDVKGSSRSKRTLVELAVLSIAG